MLNQLGLPEKLRQKLYLIPLAVLACIGFIGLTVISAGAIVNHMDIRTYVASWNTSQIKVDELIEGKLKSVIFIDVRSPEEYAEDHIADSSLVPIDRIEQGNGVEQIEKIAQAYTKAHLHKPSIVLYCSSGPRSIRAYQHLVGKGYQFVSLTGGITAWRQAIPASQDRKILGGQTN